MGCGALAAASIIVLIWKRRHSRELSARLPPALKRLAYRSDENSVTFVWQWRHRGGGSMRILKSEAHSTDDQMALRPTARRSSTVAKATRSSTRA